MRIGKKQRNVRTLIYFILFLKLIVLDFVKVMHITLYSLFYGNTTFYKQRNN